MSSSFGIVGRSRRSAFTSKARWLLLLGLLLPLVILIGVAVGAVWLSPGEIIRVLTLTGPTDSDPIARTITIVWDLRLPRAILAACVGAGLAVAGTAYQGLFRNPLAEPFVIGAASGAALGATIVIVFKLQGPAPHLIAPEPLGAFVGAIAASLLTYMLSAVVGSEPIVGLLLTGVAVGTLLDAIVWVLMTWNDQELARVVAWLMGSLAGRGWSDLSHIWWWLAIGCGGVWLMARPLDALAEGEEVASGLGLRVQFTIGLVVVLAGLATASAVAAGGIIVFVGLIAPHIARRLVGETHALLIPGSALLGSSLLVLADTVARTITAPVELPVGIVTAALGAAFFLFFLWGRRAWHG